jgi:hypothetical protein
MALPKEEKKTDENGLACRKLRQLPSKVRTPAIG